MNRSEQDELDSGLQLAELIAGGNAQSIARFIETHDFTLVKLVDESSDENFSALIAEVDDSPMLVAFSSDQHAGMFADTVPEDMLDEEGNMPAFIVGGRELVIDLTEEFGVLFNFETEDLAVMPPPLTAKVKAAMG